MKLSVSASLLLLSPVFCAATSGASPLEPVVTSQDSAREQRRELAKVGKRMLEAERDGDQGAFEELESQLIGLFEKLGSPETHEEAVALLRSAFEEFDPAALPLLDGKVEGDALQNTQQRLQELESALEMYRMVMDRYPTTEEGIGILLTGGDLGSPLIGEWLVNDAWDQPFTYKTTAGAPYELRSAGPDGVLGSPDDVLLGSQDGADEVGVGTLEALGSLKPGDQVDAVALAASGPLAAIRIQRGEESLVMAYGAEHAALETVRYPLISSSGNVVVYTAEDAGKKYLVINGTKHEIPELPIGGLRFVENTDIFAAPIHTLSGGLQWTLGDGEWLETYKERSFRPDVYPPVTSDEHDTLAVRVKHGGKWVVHDQGRRSEPSQWASQPMAIPGKKAVTYRYGDPTSTTVVIDGEKVGVHHWARNPVFSHDASRYAYAISIGGQPTKDFEAVCNLAPDEASVARILHGPAYSGGTYHVVFSGEVGPPFPFVEDPVFNPEGTDIAYAVKLADGKSAVHHGAKTSAGYKYVHALTFDRPGTSLAFIATRDGKQYLVAKGAESSACEGIHDVVGGAAGTFSYVRTEPNGQEFLVAGWSSFGPFDKVSDVGFMPDGKTPFAQVRKDGKSSFLIGQELPRWFDEVRAVPSKHAGAPPTYMAREGEAWHVVTGAAVGPAFRKLQPPMVLADGRVVYLGVAQEPGATEQAVYVMVDGERQPACSVQSEVKASPDGTRAFYRAAFADGTYRVVEVGGPTYTPKDARIDFVMFDHENRLVITESGEGYSRLIIDNVPQPAYDDVHITSIRTSPAPLTAEVELDGRNAYVSGSLTSPFFESVSDPIFSPGGQTLACRGRNDQTWHLAIGEWSSPGYDAVFAPRFTEDGKSVYCAVRIGLDLFRLTVPLIDIGQ